MGKGTKYFLSQNTVRHTADGERTKRQETPPAGIYIDQCGKRYLKRKQNKFGNFLKEILIM